MPCDTADKEIWGRVGKQIDFENALLPTTMFHVGRVNTTAEQQCPATIRGQVVQDAGTCYYVPRT